MFKCSQKKCKKKTMIEFKCRCGKVFCVTHKNPEDHSCTFDYKNEGKEKLKTKLKQVVNEKVVQI